MKNSELKKEAKMVLYRDGAGKAISLFIIPIVFLILTMAGTIMTDVQQVTTRLADGSSNSTGGNGFSIIVVILSIFIALVSVSCIFSLIQMFRDTKRIINAKSDMFQVFRKDVIFKVLFLYLWVWLFTSLWTILFVIPGLIKSLSYSQSLMILFDKIEDGTYTNSRDIITESRQLMKGWKNKYFYMLLSFVGWWILVELSFGLVGIYVILFMSATNVAFYEHLRIGTL